MKTPAEWARERWQGGRWDELVAQIQQDARAELVEAGDALSNAMTDEQYREAVVHWAAVTVNDEKETT